MPNKNKSKGNSFERQICEILGDKVKLHFQRVPNSGSFLGGLNNFRINQLTNLQNNLMDGDIITPESKPWCYFRIECKSYKTFSWNSLYKENGNAIISKWIDQASVGKKPLWFLVYKINNQGIYIVYPQEYIEKFKFKVDIYQVFKYNSGYYIITDFISFLDNNLAMINNIDISI